MNKVKETGSVVWSLFSARYWLSVVLLICAAIGLQPGLGVLAKYYKKEPIPIRLPLKEFDISELPSFRDGWVKTDIPHEEIGTDEYLIIKLDKKAGSKEQQVVALFVTFYSNPQDKVPHTPEVCYRQGGATLKTMTTITIDTPELAPQHSQIKCRFLIFQMPKWSQVVIYCFYVEGEFRYSREQTRWLMGKPGNHYSYFSKIEVTSTFPIGGDPTQATEMCKTLFRETLAVLVNNHFPTREQLKRH